MEDAMSMSSGRDRKMEWSGAAEALRLAGVGSAGTSNSSNQTFDCKICAVKSRGMSEYLKHLSKVHFKHKLLSEMPKQAPYKCPWPSCEVTKKDRFNLALHYGMIHKMALKLVQEMPEDALDDARGA